MEQQCAWAALQIAGSNAWLNATVTVSADGGSMVLTAAIPSHLVFESAAAAAKGTASASAKGKAAGAAVVVASAYGWGPIPMMSAYDAATNLPVLGWNRTVGG